MLLLVRELPAIQARWVYFVDNRIDFPGTVAIDALEDRQTISSLS